MQLPIIVKRTEGVPTIRNIRLALGPFIINMRANIEEEAQTCVFYKEFCFVLVLFLCFCFFFQDKMLKNMNIMFCQIRFTF